MIAGIGNDVVEIGRIEKNMEKQAFLHYVFTDQELAIANHSPAFLAGNFAVKESVSKALGTGFRGFSPKEVEVLRDTLGKPYVNLLGAAKEAAEKQGILRFFVTISDTQELAFAVAVAEKDR